GRASRIDIEPARVRRDRPACQTRGGQPVVEADAGRVVEVDEVDALVAEQPRAARDRAGYTPGGRELARDAAGEAARALDPPLRVPGVRGDARLAQPLGEAV